MTQPISHLTVASCAGLQGEIGLQAELKLPGDKSLSHRAALFAALAQGESTIGNFQVSGVTRSMLQGLTNLTIQWQLDDTTLRVQGMGLDALRQAWVGKTRLTLDCGNSATTLRLLAGALASTAVPAVLDGSSGLRRRPMGRIIEPLRRMGVQIEAHNDCAPLHLSTPELPLHAIHYSLPVASAQVKSCLLLAALAGDGETRLVEPGPSRDHSERMLRAMGVPVWSEEAGVTRLSPPPDRRLIPLNMRLPGDISAAAFLIVAALIVPGSQICLHDVGLNPTRTGLLDALQAMGAQIEIQATGEQAGEPVGLIRVAYSKLSGGYVSGDLVVRMIDEFPAFAIAAALAQGETLVCQAQELRYKESDRISVLVGELTQLGVAIEELPDGFRIHGGSPLSGGVAHPHGDHRLAMALALVGLVSRNPVTVMQAGIIQESFPDFPQILGRLGAQVDLAP